ncbi:MAG: tRNA lysidine(34) synthetase TilS [Acutalibacteraceae bacterium]
MICKVKSTVEKYSLLPENVKTVAVALSGGADSVCLLNILSILKDDYDIILKAVHVNHNIRGLEAKRDEDFVRNLCKNLGVELTVFSVDVPKLSKEQGLSLEQCGRNVRYECFDKVGCDAVAVAHTLSDSIETLIFNLARGTGKKGLCGITAKREPNIIRPLIECTRADVENFCNKNGLSYINDSTNASDDYTRNFIRHNLVPCFGKINGGFEKAFLRTMESLKAEDDFIETSAKELLSRSRNGEGYSAAVLSSSHEAVLKRSILMLLKQYMSKPPESKHIDLCFDIIKSGKGKIAIGKDLYISIVGDIIIFQKKTTSNKIDKVYFENNCAETSLGKFSLVKTDKITENTFDKDKIESEIYASSRLEGDSFTLSRRKVTKSLKKLFNELKIPQEIRESIAVIHDGNNVLWIDGIGVNLKYIPDKDSKNIIIIKKDG